MSVESKLSAEQAQTVLDRDIVNIMEKVSHGKTLTEGERKKFEALVIKARAGQGGTHAGAIDPEPNNRREKNVHREIRRSRVFELRMAGKTIRQMAEILGIAKDTVMKDMDEQAEEFRKQIPASKAGEFFKRQLETLSVLKRKAWEMLDSAVNDNTRLGCINRIESITEKETKMLQDAGLLAVAPIKVETSGPNGGPIETVEMPVAADHLQEWLDGYVERKKNEVQPS